MTTTRAGDTAEKRKAEEPQDSNKKQKTLEEVTGATDKDQVKEVAHQEEDASITNAADTKNNGLKAGEKNAFEEIKSDTGEVHSDAKKEQDDKTAAISNNKDSIIESSSREAEIPSSILEKGIIYFFFRARVGVEEPSGFEDVARSFIVLRPLPLGAKIGSGPIEDTKNARLIAVPKKTLPKSQRDRFLSFVDKAGKSIPEIREEIGGTEYSTKTRGTSNVPAVTPFAEGIYAITSTGRESHLAYHITIPEPSSFGEVQSELGLSQKGSFVCSIKNPTASGPAYTQIDNPAEYPEEVMKKFRGLRWLPLEPELINYDGAQMLLIGEAMGDFGKSVEESSKDAKDGEKVKPVEEVEKLEEEDHDRVKNLRESDPVFADLGLSSKEYPHLQTTWS